MKKHALWWSALVAGSIVLTGCAPMQQAARVLNLSSMGSTPVASQTSANPIVTASSAVVASGNTHRVEAGDTIYNISQRYGVEGQDLMRLNHITDPTSLAIGQVLMIPTGTQPIVQTYDRQRIQVREARLERETKPAPKPVVTPVVAPVTTNVAPISKPVTSSVSTSSADQHRVMWPVEGKVTDKGKDGIEIQSPANSVVVAGVDGNVIYAQETRGYGFLVLMRSKFDDKLVIAYSQLKDPTVQVGDVVRAGQKIGVVGDAGILKMEMRVAGKPTSVLPYLPAKH